MERPYYRYKPLPRRKPDWARRHYGVFLNANSWSVERARQKAMDDGHYARDWYWGNDDSVWILQLKGLDPDYSEYEFGCPVFWRERTRPSNRLVRWFIKQKHPPGYWD